MAKKEITDYVDFYGFDFCSLSEVVQRINEAIITYGKDAVFNYEYYGHDGGFEFQIKYTRLETDKEEEKRLKELCKLKVKNKKDKEAKLDKELREYTRLKKKYGDK